MAIDNYDKLIRALGQSQLLQIDKQSISNQAASSLTSLWAAGGIPAPGAAPTDPEICTKDLLGAFPFNNPGLGDLSYLGGAWLAGTISHLLIGYDRLTHRAGLSGATTTAQSVGLSIPTGRGAAVDGSGVDWFVEIYTLIGTTVVTATVAYTDQTDTARTTTISLGGASFNRPGRLSRIFPNPGETIKTITSITHATTGTPGNYGITCGKRLFAAPMGTPNIGVNRDFAEISMPQVPNNACIWLVLNSSGANSGDMRGALTMLQG